MTEVSKESLEVLNDIMPTWQFLKSMGIEKTSLYMAESLAREGYTIAPISKPVSDEKLWEAVAIKFHETYEKLAPKYGYETRTETRVFDKESANGKLMIAVCAEIISDLTITRAEPAPLPDDVGIDHLIKQLDMGVPDPSDYQVSKHLFDAQDRYRAAMSAIKTRLLYIKSLRAHIAALTEELETYRRNDKNGVYSTRTDKETD